MQGDKGEAKRWESDRLTDVDTYRRCQSYFLDSRESWPRGGGEGDELKSVVVKRRKKRGIAFLFAG